MIGPWQTALRWILTNLYSRWRAVNPEPPLLVGKVVVLHTDGIHSTVELPGGGRLVVLGQSVALNSWAFVRAGKIESAAPELPALVVEV